ncbi:MAG: haloacid dehalogenase-like hydrolase [Leptospiraceae bacterium]|nr:haloacid dehalogenase-like hydrolase [Leptospiraceae bacterium]
MKNVKEIVDGILNSKLAIERYLEDTKSLSKDTKPLFLAFWDFDGTILKGDCSEGLNEANGFKGLMELGVLKGYSTEFKGEEGVNAFWKKYRDKESIDKKEAYVYLPRLFSGNEEETIVNLAKEHFKSVMRNFYFPSSLHILEQLKANGIDSYILSASAHFFIKGIVGTLPIEANHMFGIEMKILNGIITSEEIEPVTYAEGKTERLKLIVNSLLEEKKTEQVFILAGFGNSFHTDGSFLQYIAEQRLLAGNPTTVMINGGNAPEEYDGIFREVNFDI